MEEIKKTSDSDMEKVSGGGEHGYCYRCNKHAYLNDNYQLYGHRYCKECFEIVDKLDRNGGNSNEEILKELASLRKEVAELRKKIK